MPVGEALKGRITTRKIWNDFLATLNFERGFFYTLLQMAYRPAGLPAGRPAEDHEAL